MWKLQKLFKNFFELSKSSINSKVKIKFSSTSQEAYVKFCDYVGGRANRQSRLSAKVCAVFRALF